MLFKVESFALTVYNLLWFQDSFFFGGSSSENSSTRSSKFLIFTLHLSPEIGAKSGDSFTSETNDGISLGPNNQ